MIYNALLNFSFVIMTNFFDLLPRKFFNVDAWDIGISLLFVLFLFRYKEGNISFIKEVIAKNNKAYIKMLLIFVAFTLIVFFYSVVVNKYPLLETIQASRQIILGYFLYFIYLRIYSNERCIQSTSRFLYFSSYLLLMLLIIQYLTKEQIFYGYFRFQGDEIRSIPIFLPICFLFLWEIFQRFLSGARLRLHESIYAVLLFTSTLLTFTRGIYFSLFLTLLFIFVYSKVRGEIKIVKIVPRIFLVTGIIIIFLTSGYGEKYYELSKTGIEDIFWTSTSTGGGTFGFRMAILEERALLVLDHNPVLGYGFLHEQSAKKYAPFTIGTWNEDDRGLSFKSADIAWANIIIYLGYTGLAIFILFWLFFVFDFLKRYKNIGSFQAALFFQMFFLFLLMWNGSAFTEFLQIPMISLAWYSISQERESI